MILSQPVTAAIKYQMCTAAPNFKNIRNTRDNKLLDWMREHRLGHIQQIEITSESSLYFIVREVTMKPPEILPVPELGRILDFFCINPKGRVVEGGNCFGEGYTSRRGKSEAF